MKVEVSNSTLHKDNIESCGRAVLDLENNDWMCFILVKLHSPGGTPSLNSATQLG